MSDSTTRFMQLNPARGRKPAISSANIFSLLGLCSSTPRGDGNQDAELDVTRGNGVVYAAQPREGTETTFLPPRARGSSCGLCSSTPRGDGNSKSLLPLR